jgi:hypothetical protein
VQHVAPRSVSNPARHPADHGEPLAGPHRLHPVQRAGRVEHEVAGGGMDHPFLDRIVDDQPAALAVLGAGQEERERQVGARALHDRVVDVQAVGHAGAVA